MRKYINYVIIFFVMFFCFNSGVKAVTVKECRYIGKKINTLSDIYVTVYVTDTGVAAYYSDHSFFQIGDTYSKPMTINSSLDKFYPGTDLCPRSVGIDIFDVLNEARLCAGTLCNWVLLEHVGGEIKDIDNIQIIFPGDKQEILTPPGRNPSIFTGTCPTDLGIISLARNFYNLLKVIAPIALVIFGTIDFAKAVVSSDEGKMKKSQSIFIKRIMAAIVIYLVMSLISFLSNFIPSESGIFECIKEIFN